GSVRPALISLLSLSMMAALVFFGATTPYQALASYPDKKSATTGVSGSAPERDAPVVASARSLPVRTYSIDEGSGQNIICTCPLSRSVSPAGEPRYGTCTMSTPAITLNNSPAMWSEVPLPADA